MTSLSFSTQRNRFKKSAQTGVSADVKAKERLATLQRDSRPLLYKFHEVRCQIQSSTSFHQVGLKHMARFSERIADIIGSG